MAEVSVWLSRATPIHLGGLMGVSPPTFYSILFTRYFVWRALFSTRTLPPCLSQGFSPRRPVGRFLSLCKPKECQPIKVLETYIFIYGRPLVSTMTQMNVTLMQEDEYGLHLTIVEISAGAQKFYRVATNPPYEPMFDVEFFTTYEEAVEYFNEIVEDDAE